MWSVCAILYYYSILLNLFLDDGDEHGDDDGERLVYLHIYS